MSSPSVTWFGLAHGSKTALIKVAAAAIAVLLLLQLFSAGFASAAITAGAHTLAMTTPTKGDAAKTFSIARPAATSNGTLLLAQITFEKGKDAGTDAQLTPSGWTLVRRTNGQSHPNGTDIGQAVFYRIVTNAAGEPASYSFPFVQPVKAAGAILPYQGVDVTHAGGPVLASSGASGSTGNLVAPSVNALDNTVVVALFGMKKKDISLSVPTGMTGLYNFQNPQDVTIRAATQAWTVGGPTGSRTSIPSPKNYDKWVAQLVVLRGFATVTNVAPVYTKPSNQTAEEGEAKAFNLGSFADPDADTPWDVTVDWGDGSSPSNFQASSPGSLGTLNHIYGDDAVYTVTVTVDDGTVTDSDTFTVTVDNVAPTATLDDDGPVDEGSSATVSFSGQSDPSTADTTAGFRYDFDCANDDTSLATTYATAGTDDSIVCGPFDDDGGYIVIGRILDKDDGYTDYTTTVTVDNVAPSATFNAPDSVNEGSNIAVSLTDVIDPGVFDTFEYRFDCGSGTWTLWGASSTENCSTVDNGTLTVKGQVRDNSLAESGEYSDTVTVDNVDPDYAAPSNQTADAGTAKNINLGTFSDVGVDDDPWAIVVDWGDGTTDTTFNVNSQGSLGSTSHTYATIGTKTVEVCVTDKDGGDDCATFQVVVTMVLYLHDNPTPPTTTATSEANLPLNTTEPTAGTLFNYATNLDSGSGVTGRFLDKGGTATSSATDHAKYISWRHPFSGTISSNIVLNGNIDLIVWAKMKASGKDIDLQAYVRECTGTTTTCTTIATLNMTAVTSASNSSFVQYTLSASSISATIDTGNTLVLRLVALEAGIANPDQQYIAYDTTTYPARLILR